ncbi:MAG: hypothetical protein H6625_11290 [Bdellovibrionaceae bacterium]|nr:hypothetical protein [Pseudobdellovibrionaceae bacterium]
MPVKLFVVTIILSCATATFADEFNFHIENMCIKSNSSEGKQLVIEGFDPFVPWAPLNWKSNLEVRKKDGEVYIHFEHKVKILDNLVSVFVNADNDAARRMQFTPCSLSVPTDFSTGEIVRFQSGNSELQVELQDCPQKSHPNRVLKR